MPDLTYYTEAEATSTLEQLGAAVSVEYEYSSDVAEGLVIRTSVGMDEPLNAGDEVILYVSQGPDPAAEANPDGETPNTAGTVTLNRSSVSLYVGDTVTLRASGGSSYTWSSSNTSVATVSSGTVTAVGRGSATITVRSGDSTATCSVTVQDYTLLLSEHELNLIAGEGRRLSVSGIPSTTAITWRSSNSRVASVNSEGQVSGNTDGTAVITATASLFGNEYSDTCQITVSSPYIEIRRMQIGDVEVDFSVVSGGTHQFNVNVFPEDANIEWSSSEPSVATISNDGVASAHSPGESTITAKMIINGIEYSDSYTMKVSAKEHEKYEYEEDGCLFVRRETYDTKTGELRYYTIQQSTPDHKFVQSEWVYFPSGLDYQYVYSYSGGVLTRRDEYNGSGMLVQYTLYTPQNNSSGNLNYITYSSSGSELERGVRYVIPIWGSWTPVVNLN